MARKIIIIFFIFILAVFQFSFLSNFFPKSYFPNLILLVSVFWTIRLGFEKSWKSVFLGGIFCDIFSNYPIGVSPISFLTAAYLANFLAKRYLANDDFLRRFATLLFIAGAQLLNDFLVFFLMKNFIFWLELSKMNLPEITLTSEIWKVSGSVLVFLIFYPLLRKFERIIFFNEQKIKVGR